MILGKIKNRIVNIKNNVVQSFLWKKYMNTENVTYVWDITKEDLFQEYIKFVSANSNVSYTTEFQDIKDNSATHQWVGAQFYNNEVIAIANDMNALLVYSFDNHKEAYVGTFESDTFKWSGGCIYNKTLYAFSRKRNSLLKLDVNTKEMSFLNTNEEYLCEHHYSGVCTNTGIIYQPPRNSDHILVWDLNKETSRKIQLAPLYLRAKFRYCGSVIHPNGYAYFLPEKDGRIIKLDLKSEQWCFIGAKISPMVFDMKVAIDGNIYGFSAYGKGILKIDIALDYAEMIHKEVYFGAYGTKLGLNGKLYSVAGDGDYIWEFDSRNDELVVLSDLKNKSKAKYAGGTISINGDIFFTPATESKICCLVSSSRDTIIPSNVYNSFFIDCY
jgi:hypothetical protein